MKKKGKKELVVEGKAKIITYKGEIKKRDITFYNPRSKLNRDLGVLLLNVFHKKTGRTFRVIDVMAATGVRGIRYVLEGKGVKEVVFNDINPEACNIIKENIKLNNLEGKVEVKVENEDANVVMNKYRFLGDVVALDPFGSAVYYLEALARCSANKSFVSVVFTDTAVLCGTYPEVARRRYNTNLVKRPHTPHEVAIRVALRAIALEMAKFDKAIKPWISIAREHYVALYFQVTKSKNKVKEMLNNLGYMHYCQKCYYKELSTSPDKQTCPYCNEEMTRIGELWIGNIHNKDIMKDVEEELKGGGEEKELKKILNIIKEESSVDGKYYDLHKLAKHNKTKVIGNDEFKRYIESRGYRVGNSHISPTTIITDAPYDIVLDAIKRENMEDEKTLKERGKEREEEEKGDKKSISMAGGKVKVAYIDMNNTLFFGGVMDEGVKETLSKLKKMGYVLCVISNLDKQEVVEKLEAFNIYDYFDVIVAALEYDMLKPDPRLINVANALIKDKFGVEVDKKRSVLIGDRPDVDIKLGRLAGIKTIRVRKGNYQHVEPEDKYEVPNYEVRSFREVISVLKEGKK